MKIGTVNGKNVNWSEKNHTVTVYGENIMMVGAECTTERLQISKEVKQ